jgi:hypothetical protein
MPEETKPIEWYREPNPHDIEVESREWVRFEYERTRGSMHGLNERVKSTKLYRALEREGVGPAVLAAFKKLLNPVED